jgi:hypothetical protein
MRGVSVSEFAKSVSPDHVVESATFWSEELQKAYFRGLGDTREAARSRLARDIGVPESYLKRLRYKVRDLSDIPGSILIRLAIGYDRICISAETKAAALRAERENLNAFHQGDRGCCH